MATRLRAVRRAVASVLSAARLGPVSSSVAACLALTKQSADPLKMCCAWSSAAGREGQGGLTEHLLIASLLGLHNAVCGRREDVLRVVACSQRGQMCLFNGG